MCLLSIYMYFLIRLKHLYNIISNNAVVLNLIIHVTGWLLLQQWIQIPCHSDVVCNYFHCHLWACPLETVVNVGILLHYNLVLKVYISYCQIILWHLWCSDNVLDLLGYYFCGICVGGLFIGRGTNAVNYFMLKMSRDIQWIIR